MAKSKDMYDIQRFSDPCDDTRTQTQIIWEEGIHKRGSLRYKWDCDFGKMDFYKLGRKLTSFFMIILFWTSFTVIVQNNALRIALQTAAFTGINAVSIWFYRLTENKRYTKLNIAYILLCIPFTLVFYKFFNIIFYYLGFNIYMSLYFFCYYMNRVPALMIRFLLSFTAIYRLRGSVSRSPFDIVNTALAAASVLAGPLYNIIGSDSTALYYGCFIGAMTLVVAALLLYIKTGDKYARNVILFFAFISVMEVVGSYAEITGTMSEYAAEGIW